MGNVIVLLVLGVLIALAVRSLLKSKGGCGCGSSGGCSGCSCGCSSDKSHSK